MSGHSKWSTIKHKKGAADAKRGRLFTKLTKAITSAARQGGGDPDANAALRTAMDKARQASMPVDNIDRAVKRGTGASDDVHYDNLVYEGYGPGGVAVMLDVMTDNKNRTVAEIRSMFTRANGSLGSDGCVAWMFDTLGQIVIDAALISDEDALIMAALDNGADDVRRDGDSYVITSKPEAFYKLRDGLTAAGYNQHESAEVSKIPKNTVHVAGKEAHQVLRLLETLEDHDDVQQVYANCDVDDDAMAEYQG